MHPLVTEYLDRVKKIRNLKEQLQALGGDSALFEPMGIVSAYREELRKITPIYEWSIVEKGEYALKRLFDPYPSNSDTKGINVSGFRLFRKLVNREDYVKVALEFNKEYGKEDYQKDRTSCLYYALFDAAFSRILMRKPGDGSNFLETGIIISEQEWFELLEAKIPPRLNLT